MSNTETNEGHKQATIPVSDPRSYGAVRAAIEACFSAEKVAAFLKSLQQARLRIRDFEDVLSKGLLGSSLNSDYSRLGNADQGQIREFYLSALERVAPELRQRFFKLYAYY